ncbi:MAG: ROK family protein [bacterium]|nr:ROK family protein [bacterium]
MNNYIGLDIGGTKIDAALVRDNKILKRKIIKTPKNKKDFLAAVFGIIQELSSDKNAAIRGIGIGMAGVIDRKAGKIIKSPNLPKLNGLNLKSALENKFGLPVRIDNDAKCFIRAEAKFGAARKRKNAIGLILGTGIGSGIMIDGKIYYGGGSAGEIGHTIIMSDARSRMSDVIIEELLSFEELVSKKGFLRLGVKDVRKLTEQARQGDKKALKIFAIVGGYLGIGLANVINTLNPEIIVLGGGLVNVANFLLPTTKKIIKKLALAPKAKNTPIIVSKLGDEAGILGAVLIFFE